MADISQKQSDENAQDISEESENGLLVPRYVLCTKCINRQAEGDQVELKDAREVKDTGIENEDGKVPSNETQEGCDTRGCVCDVIGSAYPVPDEEKLSPELRSRLEDIKGRVGIIPNMFRAMAHKEEECKAYADLYWTIITRQSGLKASEIELVALVTSLENGCKYCIVAHGALYRTLTCNPNFTDEVIANWKLADLSDRERSILEFADNVVHLRSITEDHYQQLGKHGLSRDDAWHISSIVSVVSCANRMVHALKVTTDGQFFSMGRKRIDE